MSDPLFPAFDGPGDLATIEAVPLADRGLPGTTYDLLTRAAALWPDRVALSVIPDASRFRHPAERTYARLLADVHAYANVFHAHGVRRGDAVALLAPNCDELVTATLAAELAGIAAPVNGGLTKDTVRELLAKSGARVLVTAGPELAPDAFVMARELAAAGEVDALLVLQPTASDGPGPDPLPVVDGVHIGYLAAAAGKQPHEAFFGDPPSASDVAAVFHTGGTTGTPKLAAHTHTNEISDAWMVATSILFRGRHDDVLFAALPLFHVNALVVTLLAPLFNGHRVVWAGPLGYRDPALYTQFWKLVHYHQVTAMSAVPTVYAALAARPVDADISSLRLAIVGASPLPPAVREGFRSTTGIALIEGYGLTEATCVSALNFPDHARAGAVGLRLPYLQTKVVEVDATGQWVDRQPGQIGTLVVKGPTVFPGYVTGRGPHGPLLDDLGKVRDGWLDTGDLARLDDGFVHLVGRAKDLIIRGGHNIDPAVIENTLLTHPAVTGAQAVGRPDIHSGEVPVAFVTVAPEAVITSQELRDWARDHVPEQAAAPKALTILDALPVTHVGKAFKPALRALAAGEAVTAALRGVPGIIGIEGLVESGVVTVVVGLADGADETPVKESLDRFSISWRTEVSR